MNIETEAARRTVSRQFLAWREEHRPKRGRGQHMRSEEHRERTSRLTSEALAVDTMFELRRGNHRRAGSFKTFLPSNPD